MVTGVPKFMDTEQIIVREAFLAGLIDSDGCTRVQHGSIRAKVPSAYLPIRDGIYSITRSLGLNVTVYFKAARIGPPGLNDSDLWTFDIFGGSNRQTLLSILNWCAAERKRNHPIQYPRERDREEFAEDSEDSEADGHRRELEEDAVGYSNKRACHSTADTSISYEQDTTLVANISDPEAGSYSKHYGTPDPKCEENLTEVSEPLVSNDVTSFFTCYTKSAPDSLMSTKVKSTDRAY